MLAKRSLSLFKTKDLPLQCISIQPIYRKQQSQYTTMAPEPSLLRLTKRIPQGTWDTHMHVVEPDRFPLDAKAQYQPAAHTLAQATTFLSTLNITKMVIVQPSIYGNDNSCTLDGLRQLGPKNGRAVIQFDPELTSESQIQEWHNLGVRGVRLNFKSVGATPTKEELETIMEKYAATVPKSWALELYISMENIPLLDPEFVDNLGVKIIIDHYGHPTNETLSKATTAHQVTGFSALVTLLKGGNTWVKLSAGYRLSKDPSSALVKSLCQEILKVRADRCVFATDWPHTRFEHLQVGEYLEQMLDWCEEVPGVEVEDVLVSNAEVLFDAK